MTVGLFSEKRNARAVFLVYSEKRNARAVFLDRKAASWEMSEARQAPTIQPPAAMVERQIFPPVRTLPAFGELRSAFFTSRGNLARGAVAGRCSGTANTLGTPMDCTASHWGEWTLSAVDSEGFAEASTACSVRCLACERCNYLSLTMPPSTGGSFDVAARRAKCYWYHTCQTILSQTNAVTIARPLPNTSKVTRRPGPPVERWRWPWSWEWRLPWTRQHGGTVKMGQHCEFKIGADSRLSGKGRAWNYYHFLIDFLPLLHWAHLARQCYMIVIYAPQHSPCSSLKSDSSCYVTNRFALQHPNNPSQYMWSIADAVFGSATLRVVQLDKHALSQSSAEERGI